MHLKDLVQRTAAAGLPAVAVTDTANLFGALEFALAAADAGVQPVVGTLLPMLEPGGKSVAYLPPMRKARLGISI